MVAKRRNKRDRLDAVFCKDFFVAKHIVIVEDDPDQRSNYADAITNKGYQVSAYGNREDALAAFDDELPDLAILDIILGDEVDAGFQLCRELLARSPSLPVIFLTERINEIDKISGLRLGAWAVSYTHLTLPTTSRV